MTTQTMTIKQAVERVEACKENIELCNNQVFMIRRDKERLKSEVWVKAYADKHVRFLDDTLVYALRKQIAEDEAEIARLQPVIDMANAALKGVLS